MECPYCRNEMETGYIQSRDGLGWSTKKRLVAALSAVLSEQNLGKSAIAYRCKECRKIIIDFAGSEE